MAATETKETTETWLALREPTTKTPLAMILTPMEAESLRIQAQGIYASQLLQAQAKGQSAESAQASAYMLMLMAAELHLLPVTTAQRIYIIEGRASMPGELVQAILERSGIVDWEEEEGEDGTIELEKGQTVPNYYCALTMWRRDKPERRHTARWDLARAQRIGLYPSKSNWRNYPQELCHWRCMTQAGRRVAPDVLMGMYAVEEFDYREDDLRGDNLVDPRGPIGEEAAMQFQNALASAPNRAETECLLAELKERHWGSAEYKFQSVPQSDKHIIEEFVKQRLVHGPRIGNAQANELLARVQSVAEKAGKPEDEVMLALQEKREAFGAETFADLTKPEANTLTYYLAGVLEDAQIINGDFEPADPAPVKPEPSTDANELQTSQLFPRGGETPLPDWRNTCIAHGIEEVTYKRLQVLAIGELRPPDDPDEMAVLVNFTCDMIAGRLKEKDLPPLPEGEVRRLFDQTERAGVDD